MCGAFSIAGANIALTVNTGRLSWLIGMMPFASERQEVIERFALADSRKMSLSSMLTQPSAERKDVETSAKSSTWWERICVEMYGNLWQARWSAHDAAAKRAPLLPAVQCDTCHSLTFCER